MPATTHCVGVDLAGVSVGLHRGAWLKPGAFLAMPASCTLGDDFIEADVRKVQDSKGLYEAWFEEVPKPAA